MNVSKKAVIALCLIALVATMSTVLAAGYLIVSPASDQLTVNPKPTDPDPDPEATLSKVKLGVNTITEGDSVTLTTTLSDGLHLATKEGHTVVFYDQNDNKVGQTTTNIDGRACISITPSAAGTYTYYATCNIAAPKA